MKKAFLFLANGFEESEAIVPLDILRRGGVSVTTVSISEKKEVTGAHNIIVVADVLFDDCKFENYDMLILPGGMPGAQNLNDHSGLKGLILQSASKNIQLAAICAAPMVYGELGLLNGLRATSYPGFEGKLKGATYTGEMVSSDGIFTTGKGPGAAYDFGFTLLAKLMGEETAQSVRNAMFP